MSNLDNANAHLFTFLVESVETNVDHKNFRLCNPSDVIDSLKKDNAEILEGLESYEIIPTFISLIDQCHEWLDDASTLFASELLTEYLKS